MRPIKPRLGIPLGTPNSAHKDSVMTSEVGHVMLRMVLKVSKIIVVQSSVQVVGDHFGGPLWEHQTGAQKLFSDTRDKCIHGDTRSRSCDVTRVVCYK